jgi:acyl carrier protein
VLGLTESAHPARGTSASHTDSSSITDALGRDIIDILKSLSRRPINPTPDSELMADLGFDSLQVLELVGELEDRFGIAVPLNSLTHIRTVSQIEAEIRRLVAEQAPPA